jgi:hypothetical protein
MKRKNLYTALVLLVLINYTLTLKGKWGNPVPGDFKNNLDQATQPLELSPERGRFALTMSLVKNRTFNIGETLAEAVYPDVGYFQDRYYIFFPPGISLMAVPFYVIGSYFNLAQVFSFFMSAIFALGSAVFIYLIARRIFKIRIWASLFGCLTYSFGSVSWPYAVTLYQHQVTAFLMLSAFYCAWAYRNNSIRTWIYALWVGAAAAWSVWVDYPNALFFIPILVYFFLYGSEFKITKTRMVLSVKPSLAMAAVIFGLIILVHGYYNYSQFGSPMRLSGSLPGYVRKGEQKLQKEGAGTDKNLVGYFTENQFINGLYVLTVSTDRGLFLFSPIFALGFLGLYLISRRKATMESATLLATVVMIIFLYSSWGDPWGGWAFGPRYLIPALAILSIFIAWFVGFYRRLLARIVAFILFAYSAAIALLGVLTTNAVPPLSEAVILHSEYNFLHNWAFFIDDRSSSFVYNTWFSAWHLWQYALPIYLTVITAAIVFIFILPLNKQYDN